MRRQVVDYRLPFRRDLPLEHELLEPLLDFSNLRPWRDPPNPHDLVAGDYRLEPRRALGADGVQPGLQLVELLRLGIRRGADVGARKRHQALEEWSCVAGQPPDGAVRPLR